MKKGLKPETKYEVVIGYVPEGEEEFRKMDTMRFWTESVESALKIELLSVDEIGYYANGSAQNPDCGPVRGCQSTFRGRKNKYCR